MHTNAGLQGLDKDSVACLLLAATLNSIQLNENMQKLLAVAKENVRKSSKHNDEVTLNVNPEKEHENLSLEAIKTMRKKNKKMPFTNLDSTREIKICSTG